MKKIILNFPKYFLLFCLLSNFLTATSFGVLIERGIEPFNIKGGARSIGMGNAYVGLCDDVNALFFNPAGLARTKGIGLTIRDMDNFSAGQVFPTGYGFSLGIGFVRRTIIDLPYSGGETSSFSNIFVASAGTRLSFLSNVLPGGELWEQIDLGLDTKYLLGQTLKHTGDPDRSATGWDADLGLIWKPEAWMKLGLVFENMMGSTLLWDTDEEDDVRPATTFGAGFKVIGDKRSPIYMDGNELLISTDFSLRGSEPTSTIALGAEWVIDGTYAFRIGNKPDVMDDKVKTGITLGLGMRFGYWGMDIAQETDPYSDLPAYHFSIQYWPKDWVFIKKPEEDKKPKEESIKDADDDGEIVKFIGPSEELVTDSDRINIKGVVLKPGAEISINGNQVSVDENDKFDVEVPLNIGKNLVEISTEYRGKKTIVKRKILRKVKIVTPEDKEIEEVVEKEIKPEEENITKMEADLKPKEIKISAAEENIEELEKEELTDSEKEDLENEKRRIEEEKKRLQIEKTKISAKKKELAVKKNKIEKKKEEIKEKKQAVEDLATLGVIDITPDKVFEVEAPITRAELASWLVKASGVLTEKLSKDPFKDVSRNHPHAREIQIAVESGLMPLFSDGTFRPDKAVTDKEGKEIFDRFTK